MPLFQNGCMEKPGNYSPVSLTEVVTLLLEGFLKKMTAYFGKTGTN